jgi:glucosamine 6-phosphate synthetase-like amidotransferase/phosphosugar isomerase protein
MCCLFGFVDYGHQLSRKQRSRLLSILSTACEERGTDATGIAYNADGKQVIFKRPLPAHLMWYRVPADATIVMGHTRMTTQGSEKKNENNHPFSGNVGKAQFALAHNGVLYNDKSLRRELKLPDTKIETDSYVAVQLLEKYGKLDFDALRFMSEELEGSFTISALSDRDELFIAKGNNPIVIQHFPDSKLYVYASTEEILQKALMKTGLPLGRTERVSVYTGELLRIDERGKISRSHFDDSKLYATFMPPWSHWGGYEPVKRPYADTTSYLDDLKSVAVYFGIYPEDVDALIEDGMTPDEIEEFLYCG